MKKRIIMCVTALIVLLVTLSMSVSAASYPLIYPSDVPEKIVKGTTVQLKFKIFHEFKNEKYNINIYEGKSTSSYDLVASAGDTVYNYNNLMTDLSINFDTTGYSTGVYTIEYYMEFYSFYEWHQCPNRYTYVVEIIEDVCKGKHTWNKGTVTVKATCTKEGEKEFTCTKCGVTKTEAVKKAAHTYDSGTVTKKATCSQTGVKTFKCKNCTNTKTEAINKIAHKWNSGKVTTAATCVKNGVKTYTCTVCSATKTEAVKNGAHKWNSGKITTASTCLKNGVKTYTCTLCKATKNETLAKSAHKWNNGVVTVPSTCEKIGTKTFTCTVCKVTKTGDIPKVPHSWDEGVVITPATITRPGLKNAICTVCDVEGDVEIPATFIDIKANSYYEDSVIWAYENNITKGTSENQFSPGNICSRAQFVTFLWRTYNCPEPTSTENPFVDVKPGQYYSKAVMWAYENGITTGTSKTEFSPDAVCTRGQIVTFLWRSNGCPEVDGLVLNRFEDVSEDAFYFDAVIWAVYNDITKGIDEYTFAPKNKCSRAEIVTFLKRASFSD